MMTEKYLTHLNRIPCKHNSYHDALLIRIISRIVILLKALWVRSVRRVVEYYHNNFCGW